MISTHTIIPFCHFRAVFSPFSSCSSSFAASLLSRSLIAAIIVAATQRHKTRKKNEVRRVLLFLGKGRAWQMNVKTGARFQRGTRNQTGLFQQQTSMSSSSRRSNDGIVDLNRTTGRVQHVLPLRWWRRWSHGRSCCCCRSTSGRRLFASYCATAWCCCLFLAFRHDIYTTRLYRLSTLTHQ